MTGGMLPQHDDLLEIIDLCRRLAASRSRSAGLASTSVPHFYARANFRSGRSRRRHRRFHRGMGIRCARGRVHRQEIRDRCPQDADPALRSAEVRSLSAMSACSSRAAARSTASSATSSSCTAGCRAPRPPPQMLAELTRCTARLPRACRFRRRQLHRQQEGREGFLPELSLACEAHDYPFDSPPRPRSISPTTTSCCG